MKTIKSQFAGGFILLFIIVSFGFLTTEGETNSEVVKLTVIYGHPDDPDAFEKYYNSTHAAIAAKMKGVSRMELTKFESAPDGSPIEFYRMAELYFPSLEAMQQTLNSPEGKATLADVNTFATGGISVIIGSAGDFQFDE
ncbi:MAG TPA: EthD family reductase [Gillisia sp.]|nr:EthD family reductase [Gillisia sp.]